MLPLYFMNLSFIEEKGQKYKEKLLCINCSAMTQILNTVTDDFSYKYLKENSIASYQLDYLKTQYAP